MPRLAHRSESSASPDRIPPRRDGAVPVSVWLITALWGTLLVGASLLWPMTYGYDEPQHIDMAYVYSSEPFHFYGPGELLPTRADIAVQGQQPGYPPSTSLAAAPIPDRAQRRTFDELGGHASAAGAQPNQMVQHPPLYYWLEAGVLRAPGVSQLAWDLQVWLMRLLSVILMLPVPVLCWAAARRLLGTDPANHRAVRLAPLAATVPLTVPNLIRDGSSVTNDSLLILSVSVVLCLLCRVVTGDLSRRTAAWISVGLAVALLSKGFALMLPVAILAAYLTAVVRRGKTAERVRALAAPLGIVAVGAIVGGVWWARNLIVYGAVQVDGFGAAYERVLHGPPDNGGTLVGFAPTFLIGFISRIWGGIGLPDAPSPGPVVVYGWFVMVLIGILAALLIRARAGDRARALVLLTAPVLTVAVVTASSYSGFHKWSSGVRGSQGRYIYQLVVVLAALAAVGWIRIVEPRLASSITPVVVLATLITNAVAWFVVLRSWYQPDGTSGGLADAGRAVLRWSPVSPAVTITLVVVLPAITGVAALTATLLEARRLGRPGTADETPTHRDETIPVTDSTHPALAPA